MAEILINKNECVSLGSVDDEGDLNPKQGTNINPPPRDECCYCCGSHIKDLKPFGGPGDPLIGDFSGAKLVKKIRSIGPYCESEESAYHEAEMQFEKEGFSDLESFLAHKYGEKEANRIIDCVAVFGMCFSSWECRKCIILDDDQYFEMRRCRDGQKQPIG